MAMTAAQAIELKAKVKSEMLRRAYTGSVSSYGGSAYDFTVVPSIGTPITADQGNKIIQPLLAVKDISGLSNAVVGQPIPSAFDYTNLNTIVTNLAAEAMTGDSSCRVSCTGLCEGSCQGSCQGSCVGSCVGSCYGTCYAVCGGNCTGSCVGGCYMGCGSGCQLNCDTMCLSECGMIGY